VIASHSVINETRDYPEPDSSTLPQFASLAVHELRTPVTVVAGYLRMLLREQGGPLSDKQRKMLEEADRSCARLGSVVAEMSEVGKLEAHELALARSNFDLAALVDEVAAAMPENDRGVRIEVRGGDRQLLAIGDRARIAAAIKALLHAAVRERGEPGVVVAECNIVETWGVVAICDEVLLPSFTRDAGSAPSGFDEWRGGMGLSLPVARRVLEAHGGAIWSAGEFPRQPGSPRADGLRLPLAVAR
jgi:signal transduction histidine kinase